VPPSPEFGAYLAKAIEAAGMSNADLARLTGLADSLISKWRANKALPTMPNLRLLAPALRIPPMELFVRAGHVLPEEAGMAEMPEPPEAPTTPEGEIMAQSWLPDEAKAAMVTLLGELRASYERPSGRSTRADRAGRS
jgi:transcriptional regulator with XRE-family HTH domain